MASACDRIPSAQVVAACSGRLGLSEATDALLHYWEATIHSSARKAILEGLRGRAPRAADAQAVEALDDCEPAVQQIACALAPDSGHVRARLVELRDDPLASEIRGTIVRRLKEGRAAVRPRQA